ncbi:MAG: S-layer homology domain-containing protein [Oscillospiraceae bacterium]|nr:S-layer homology domain-containing protein [Oscillospiraceae bacterium]
MGKRAVSLILAVILAFCLLPAAMAAEESMDNFKKVAEYPEGKFTDVPPRVWYQGYVIDAYEFGLITGDSESTFSPSRGVTIAEAITLAARIHSIHCTGGFQFVQDMPWYKTYVDYAIENGIIGADEYVTQDDMNAEATRMQYAAIMAKALPDSALPEINTVEDGAVPDVKMTDAHAADIYRLYRAGILTGRDKKGTFDPDANINRAEIAALAMRMAVPALRESVTLKKDLAGYYSGDLARLLITPADAEGEYNVKFFVRNAYVETAGTGTVEDGVLKILLGPANEDDGVMTARFMKSGDRYVFVVDEYPGEHPVKAGDTFTMEPVEYVGYYAGELATLLITPVGKSDDVFRAMLFVKNAYPATTGSAEVEDGVLKISLGPRDEYDSILTAHFNSDGVRYILVVDEYPGEHPVRAGDTFTMQKARDFELEALDPA